MPNAGHSLQLVENIAAMIHEGTGDLYYLPPGRELVWFKRVMEFPRTCKLGQHIPVRNLNGVTWLEFV